LISKYFYLNNFIVIFITGSFIKLFKLTSLKFATIVKYIILYFINNIIIIIIINIIIITIIIIVIIIIINIVSYNMYDYGLFSSYFGL
jgi:hypothetical protein